MKIVFMGTPDFSVNVLNGLISNYDVSLVVTQPDKEVGRKREIKFSPVKEAALKNNIEVFQPKSIKNDYQRIVDVNPDIIITCAYGQIIPKAILDLPKFGAINVHASLLPKLRGGSPIHHALIDGLDETGITIMYMVEKMDAGDIISQEITQINDEDNLESLHDRLSVMGRDLLLKTLPDIINNNIKPVKQNDEEVTFAYNISRDEEILDFNDTKRNIFNKIRGLSPYPGAYTYLDNKILKIYKTSLVDKEYSSHKSGTIIDVDKEAIYVRVNDGVIKLLDVQLEGKKRMATSTFLQGKNKEELIGKILGDFNE